MEEGPTHVQEAEETPTVEDLVDRPAKMRKVEEPGGEPSAPSVPSGSPAKGISRDSEKMILRMSQKGLSPETIADVLNVEAAEIMKTLELTQCGAQDSHTGGQVGEHGLTSLVKRLMVDPPDLCCPISHALMEDPVVAADGFHYDRSCIKDWLQQSANAKSPSTGLIMKSKVLNPSQRMKSAVIAYKEKTIQEILSVASQVTIDDVFNLLSRGEQFVRSSLQDRSAKRKLASLLLLRGKRMQPGNRGAVMEELMPILLETRDTSELQELVADMDEQEVLWLLSQADEGFMKTLSVPAPCKILVCKELARRIASSTGADEQGERLNYLWDFLHQHQATNAQESWVEAASLVLAAFSRMLTVQMERLDVKLLRHACGFLCNQEFAASLAKKFFDSDLGISSLEKWPPQSSASIFAALASLVDDNKDEEKLELLVKAHELNDSDAEVRFALSKQLSRCMLRQRTTDDGKHLEGLLLKLHLEREEEIPAEVMSKLSLQQESLKSLCGPQLILLAEMLKKGDRRADGARVAVAAAETFSADGKEDESHGAIAFAHYLDRTNDEASLMLCNLLGSIVGKCKGLDSKCQDLDKRSTGLNEKYTELLDKYKQLQKAQEAQRKQSQKAEEAQRKQLSNRCHELEKAQRAIKPPVWQFTWDLSGYNFTNFTEDQQQLSEKFQLGASGVEAWLDLRPKASPDKASLFLWVSEPVWVKWRFQAGSWENTLEWDFQQNADGGDPLNRGWGKAIPISNLASGIAFHLLSVRRAGSSLRLVAPGS